MCQKRAKKTGSVIIEIDESTENDGIPISPGNKSYIQFNQRQTMGKRVQVMLKKDKDRVKRLKRLTLKQSAREMEALLSFPWPRRRTKDPKVPRNRFITV